MPVPDYTPQDYYSAWAQGSNEDLYNMYLQEYELEDPLTYQQAIWKSNLEGSSSPWNFTEDPGLRSEWEHKWENMLRKQRIGRELAKQYTISSNISNPVESSNYNTLQYGTNPEYEKRAREAQQYATQSTRNDPLWGQQAQDALHSGYTSSFMANLANLASPGSEGEGEGEGIPSWLANASDYGFTWDNIWGMGGGADADQQHGGSQYVPGTEDLGYGYSQEDLQNAFYTSARNQIADQAINDPSGLVGFDQSRFDTVMNYFTSDMTNNEYWQAFGDNDVLDEYWMQGVHMDPSEILNNLGISLSTVREEGFWDDPNNQELINSLIAETSMAISEDSNWYGWDDWDGSTQYHENPWQQYNDYLSILGQSGSDWWSEDQDYENHWTWHCDPEDQDECGVCYGDGSSCAS